VIDFGAGDGPLPLGRQLAYTHKVLHDQVDATLNRHGADLNTWIVLFQAQRHGGGLAYSQRELAEGLHISGPALVRHLDRLEGDGLLRRRRDDKDRRITRITLTAKGERLLARLHDVMAENDRQMRAQLSADEARTLEIALAKLHEYGRNARPDEDEDNEKNETEPA
jgi:MarR family transcriptional regulator, transcriptional regulator for hemolysin